MLLIAESIIEIFPNNLPAVIDGVGAGKKNIGGKRHVDGFQRLFSSFFEIEAVLSVGRVGADDSSTIIDSKSYGAAGAGNFNRSRQAIFMNKRAQGPGSVGKTADYMPIVVNPRRERVNGVWDINGNKVVRSSLCGGAEKKSSQ